MELDTVGLSRGSRGRKVALLDGWNALGALRQIAILGSILDCTIAASGLRGSRPLVRLDILDVHFLAVEDVLQSDV